MSIRDGQSVNAAVTNPAFISANDDSTGFGIVQLANADAASGPTIVNLQREHNSVAAFVGKAINTAKDATPIWTNGDLGASGDNLKQRIESLTAAFNPATGHDHSGSAGSGAPISASNISSVPLKGYVKQGVDIASVTGSSINVSSQFASSTASTGTSVPGVVVLSPYNRLILRYSSGTSANDEIVSPAGDQVYGRLTYASSVWTISFYTLIVNTETAYSFATATGIRFFYQELFNPLLNPPVYSEFAIVPSENTTADVIGATTTNQGKVTLSSATSSPIGSAGTAGSATGTVSNADHTHAGVHSLSVLGVSTQLLGDVVFEAGNNIVLDLDSGKIRISGPGAIGVQEPLGGPVNGTNATFGPMSQTPSNAGGVIVFVDGIALPATAWTLSGLSITLSSAYIPNAGQSIGVFYITAGAATVAPTPTGMEHVEYHAITTSEASAKTFTLEATPSAPSKVMVDVIGGSAQIFNVDFTVSGNQLNWSGYGLDGFLSSTDTLRLHYYS